ncbi:MAG TPA: DUF484 family protein [Roseomonas sp.]|jgi:hypothetical protein
MDDGAGGRADDPNPGAIRSAGDRPPEPSAVSVEAWLRAHPDFLAERPALYAALTPPKRVHGPIFADHMAAMLAAERARMAALEAEVERVLALGRASDGFTARVARAVLALMGTRDPIEAVTQELPALLGLESCSLAAEAPPRRGVFALPAGTVHRLIGAGREALVRAEPAEAALLHAEAAPLIARDALARVPLPGGAPMLIALGAREAAALPDSHAAPQLAFLGRAVAVALAR